jgi:xanthine dehydrogenase accessory factor
MRVFHQAEELDRQGEEFCLAVVVAKSGSAPQVPGAKSLFTRDGRVFGTIGGGCLEMEVRRLSIQALHTKNPIRKEFQLDDDFGWDDGLICGGRVQVLILPEPRRYIDAFRRAVADGARGVLRYSLKTGDVSFNSMSDDLNESEILALTKRREVLDDINFYEPIMPAEQLIVFGGGHIGKEVARIGAFLEFGVTVVDDREEFLSEERLPFVKNRICDDNENFAKKLREETKNDYLCEETYVCIVTRGHRNDSKVLRHLIGKPWGYLGMIGSKRKREVVKKQMLEEGWCTKEEFEQVRSPMGLDIGAESVPEIAISICADLVQARAQRRGGILARCEQKKMV